MKPSSAKAKGRKFQQFVISRLIEVLNIDEYNIENRSMGASGEDVILAAPARKKFPYTIECKHVEKLNVYAAYEQASQEKGKGRKYEPILIMRKNRKKPLVVLDLESFLKTINEFNLLKSQLEDNNVNN